MQDNIMHLSNVIRETGFLDFAPCVPLCGQNLKKIAGLTKQTIGREKAQKAQKEMKEAVICKTSCSSAM